VQLELANDLNATSIPERWVVGKSPTDIREYRTRIQEQLLVPLKRASDEDRSLLRAVRSALIAADAAGSGYAREGQPIARTVWKEFVERPLLTREDIWKEIISNRLKQINAKGKPFEWNQFQIACDNLPERALLLAPCGSGKTLAAWRWIAAQCASRPVGRVLFLYPTRATAKEGFRDYVSWAPESDAALMHGNAAFDLDGMFDNGDARGDGSNYEADRRLFSLGYWPRRIFSATVDQFLGYLQYGYGSMCMVPVLADSVIVIDEVHSFDRHMFTALKAFLRNFKVPVLCMTATLPNDRRDALKTCGLEIPNDDHDDLKRLADAQRYTLTTNTKAQAIEAVRRALAEDRRVLWVANTVRRCHDITARFVCDYRKMTTPSGVPVYCYHSRYKLTDRVARHEDIINALKVDQPAALGVTTQVCEMSLDLDVDLLVTEECPVTSLIQRMGRCNRARDPRELSLAGRVVVYKPESPTPYTADDLKGLEEFLNKTAGKPLSQSVLETTLGELKETPPWLGDNVVMFLESGAYAVGPKADDEDATTFREGNDFNRPCLLPTEVEKYLDAEAHVQPGFVVPVPKKLALANDSSALPKYLGIATDNHYHPTIGYCDELLSKWGTK
jgi:CRISPR-associated endonuclease/helicase Cas3